MVDLDTTNLDQFPSPHDTGSVTVTSASLTYSDKPRAGVGGVMLSGGVGRRLVEREGPQAHYGRVRLVVTRPSTRHHILHPESPASLGGAGAVKHHDL